MIIPARRRQTLRDIRDSGMPLDEVIRGMGLTGQSEADLRAQYAVVAAEKRRATPSYKAAVTWIAQNDEPRILDDDPESPDWVGGLASVALIAHLFGKSIETVARDVVAKRKKGEKRHGG